MSDPEAGPWCLSCGYRGRFRANSLDPAHPFGHCQRGQGTSKGCGQVVLTYDKAEGFAAYDRRRRRFTTARHADHVRGGGPATYCSLCPHEPVFRQLVTPGTLAGAVQAPAARTGKDG